MYRYIFLLSLFVFVLNSNAQNKKTIDSCTIKNTKFLLVNNNGIAKLKAYSGDLEIPIKGVVKMSPPSFFIKERKNKNKVLQDEVFAKNGDVVTVFLLVGNEAPSCMKNDYNLKFKEDFCGMSVQGVVISPDGIKLTEFMYNGLTCIRENALETKDLWSFVNRNLPEK